MSWLFSRALVEEYSEVNFSDGEQCAPLNLMPTEHPFLHRDRMTAFSSRSQYGVTFDLLTESRGEELLMSFLEASHVKTSASQEEEKEYKEKEVPSGGRCIGLFEKFGQDSCSLKIPQLSLFVEESKSLSRLPKWGTWDQTGYWEQDTLEPIIREIESGYLPTPDANEGMRGPAKKYNPKAKSQSGRTLTSFVASFPTPTSSMYKSSGPSIVRKDGKKRTDRLDYVVERNSDGSTTGGRLNPAWVEWLMNFPNGWSDIKPMKMERFYEWKVITTGQSLQLLWKELQQKNLQRTTRGQKYIRKKEILFSVVCELQKVGLIKRWLEMEGEKETKEFLRSVFYEGKITSSSQRQEHKKQFRREYTDTLYKLSRKASPRNAVKRVANGVPYRMERLKALGNAQVPAVAAKAFSILHKRNGGE